jgi:gliding motility-associated-like protein
MKRLLLLIGVIIVSGTAQAQITINAGYNASQLAQTLVGAGVVMMNPTLAGQCPTEGAGSGTGRFSYNGTPSDIGIDSGIVLTCGSALNISNPFGFFASSPFTGGIVGDPDLTALINLYTGLNTPSMDACVLEFDFIPAGDTVKFDYVFASEEYAGPHGNYNCSINDVFGFFISGPGYASPTNIALVPGTNVMVGVSTVNDGTGGGPGSACDVNTFGNGPYTAYYNVNPGLPNFVYSGFTDVFTAIANVVPCDTYHLKLAISDAQDQSWDSGVFLKAGSLNSTGIKLTPESTEGGHDTLAHCIRGCKSGFIKFARAAARITPLTVKYLIEGTAINGVDYQYIADSIVIPANQLSAELEIKPLLVQYPSGTKKVVIKALSPYVCANGSANVIDSAIMYIYDSLFVNIPTAPITVCPNTEITITADIDSTLDFEWTPAALIPDPLPLGLTIHPKPTVPTTYSITVTQPGAPATCPSVKRSYLANVEPIPQIHLPSKDTTICLADSVDLNVYSLPAGINYTYLWSPADHLRDNTSANNKFYAPVGDYKLVLTSTTPVAGCSNKDSMIIHVVPPFDFEYVTPVDTTIRYGDRIQLNSESEAIYWLWSPLTYLSDPLAKDPYATPLEPMIYTLIGINQYGCKDTATVKIDVDYNSLSIVPNAFSPNGDGTNDVFKIEFLKFDKLIEFRIFNRWGEQVFETNNPSRGWDGNIKGKPATSDVYYYLIKLTLPDGTPKTVKGDLTLIR